jgi:hypothetical protein
MSLSLSLQVFPLNVNAESSCEVQLLFCGFVARFPAGIYHSRNTQTFLWAQLTENRPEIKLTMAHAFYMPGFHMSKCVCEYLGM